MSKPRLKTTNGSVERLVLPCSAFPENTFTLEPMEGDPNTLILRIAQGEDEVAGRRAITISDAAARVLFNTLGIWLVRKGPN